MKKTGKFCARFLVAAATVMMLLGCLLVARLIIAPIDLEFAKDEIDNQVSGLLPGWKVSYSKATLGWDWQAVKPWIIITDLRLVDRRNRLMGNVPRVQVGTSFSTLYGDIQVSSVNVHGAKVEILDIGGYSDDENTGSFSDLFGETGVPHINILKPLTEAFSRFSNRLITEAPKFKKIEILNTAVTVNRGPDIDVARLSVPSLLLERNDDILIASSTVDVSLGNVPAKVNVNAQMVPVESELGLRLGFSELVPKDIVNYLQLPAFFTSLDFPVSLDVDFSLNADQGLRQAVFLARVDKGVLYHPSLFPEKANIEFGNISAHFDPGEQIFVFDQIELSLGGPLVEGNGIIYWLDGEATPGLRLAASAESATIEDVLRFWPIARRPDGSEKGARAWVSKNMIGGTAKNARFDIDIPPDGESTFKSESPYELSFSFDDIDTHFIQSMPPVRGAKGNAFLTETDLSIKIDSGALVGLPVTNVTASLSDINSKEKSFGNFSFELSGDVQEILTLINNPPLSVANKINLDINRFAGQASVNGIIGTPLNVKPGNPGLVYDVTANLSGFGIADILEGEGVKEAEAILNVTPNAIEAEGRARLNGVWADFTWDENLLGGRKDADLQTTRIVATGTTDQNGLAALKIDAERYLDGNISFETTLKGRNFVFEDIEFRANADEAKLSISELSWSKPSGHQAVISGKAKLSDNAFHLSPLVLQGKEINVVGDFKWTNGDLIGLFDAKQLGQNILSAKIDIPTNDTANINLKATKLDLRPFLNGVDSVDGEILTDLQPIEDLFDDSETIEPAANNEVLNLTVKADQLLLLNGETIESLKFDGKIITGLPYSITATGTMKNSASDLKFTLIPTRDVRNTPTKQKLTLSSSDGGGIMRGLGIFPHLNKGELLLDVMSFGWGGTWHMEGSAKVENTLLVNKDTLGPQVTEGILDGLEEYVDDGGIKLDVVDIPFIYDRGLLDLNGLKANGGSIGMTMEGQLHTQSGKINMNGVIVPAYRINSLLGKIPLIGSIFSGGEGKGLFGFTYRIKGATNNPNIEVSRLSGIAPGFIRSLFEGRKGKVEDVVLPEEEEKTKDKEPPQAVNDSSSSEKANNDGSENKPPSLHE